MSGLCIAIVGAESTGKSTLAQDLALRLAADTGLRCAFVGEHLRDWCERAGRTPRADEQAAIAATQLESIAAACRVNELVIADTTPLMTAIYSQLLFDDQSLLAGAVEAQRQCFALTLLTALDLPWVADGLQRDGAHVQAPVDAALRQALIRSGLPWSVVAGRGEDRIEAALTAVTPLLRPRIKPGQGLFTRLQARQDALPTQAWIGCDCDVPECEHASLRQARESGSTRR